MKKGFELYQLPRTVGDGRLHPFAILAVVLAIVGTNLVATEVVAIALRYNPTLGHAVFSAGPLRVYAPWAWLVWGWMFLDPLSGYDYAHHAGRWPDVVYAVYWRLPNVFGAGAIATIVAPIAAQLIFGRRRQDVGELVDSAHFADTAELREAGLLTAAAGPIIGAWPLGPFGLWRKPIRYAEALGINYIGPSGDGKSSFLLISNLLVPLRDRRARAWDSRRRRAETWGEEPSWVIFDPTGELFEKTSRYQRDILGKQVFRLDPLSSGDGLAKWNPCWSIALGTDREQQGCRRVLTDIIDPQGRGLVTYWDRESCAFGDALIAFIGYQSLYMNDPTLFSLPGLTDYISQFDTIEDLCDDVMGTYHDPHGVFGWTTADGKPTKYRSWIVDATRIMRNKGDSPEERRGVFSSLIQHLSLYRDPVLRRNVCESSFSFAALANSARAGVVYIAAHPMDIPILQPYLRTVTRAALRELIGKTRTDGDGRTVRDNVRATILALDEAAVLGRLDELELVGGYLRKFGVILWLFWQATNQLTRLYPEESFSENLGVHIWGRPQTPKAAEPISESLGQFSTLLTRTTSSGSRWSATPLDHVSANADVTTRQLLTVNEVLRLPPSQILIRCAGLLIRAHKYFFFRQPQLRRRAKMGAVERSDVATTEPLFHTVLRSELGEARFKRLLQRPAAPDLRPPPRPPKPSPTPEQAAQLAAAAAIRAVTAAAKVVASAQQPTNGSAAPPPAVADGVDAVDAFRQLQERRSVGN